MELQSPLIPSAGVRNLAVADAGTNQGGRTARGHRGDGDEGDNMVMGACRAC